MATLTLVRHGQASFLSDDYDQLSPLGGQQSNRLGEFLAGRDAAFTRVITGPLKRQIDTAAEVSKAFRREGSSLPKPEIFAEFAEYDGDAIMRLGLPLLLEQDERVRNLLAVFEAATGERERHAAFQRVFEVVQRAWGHGELAAPELETYDVFRARVNAGFDRIVREANSAAKVIVFTSGGPIALAMQRALSLSTEHTLQTSWMARNASLSDFLFSGNRFTLSSFNAFGHLDHPAMLTYR